MASFVFVLQANSYGFTLSLDDGTVVSYTDRIHTNIGLNHFTRNENLPTIANDALQLGTVYTNIDLKVYFDHPLFPTFCTVIYGGNEYRFRMGADGYGNRLSVRSDTNPPFYNCSSAASSGVLYDEGSSTPYTYPAYTPWTDSSSIFYLDTHSLNDAYMAPQCFEFQTPGGPHLRLAYKDSSCPRTRFGDLATIMNDRYICSCDNSSSGEHRLLTYYTPTGTGGYWTSSPQGWLTKGLYEVPDSNSVSSWISCNVADLTGYSGATSNGQITVDCERCIDLSYDPIHGKPIYRSSSDRTGIPFLMNNGTYALVLTGYLPLVYYSTNGGSTWIQCVSSNFSSGSNILVFCYFLIKVGAANTSEYGSPAVAIEYYVPRSGCKLSELFSSCEYDDYVYKSGTNANYQLRYGNHSTDRTKWRPLRLINDSTTSSMDDLGTKDASASSLFVGKSSSFIEDYSYFHAGNLAIFDSNNFVKESVFVSNDNKMYQCCLVEPVENNGTCSITISIGSGAGVSYNPSLTRYSGSTPAPATIYQIRVFDGNDTTTDLVSDDTVSCTYNGNTKAIKLYKSTDDGDTYSQETSGITWKVDGTGVSSSSVSDGVYTHPKNTCSNETIAAFVGGSSVASVDFSITPITVAFTKPISSLSPSASKIYDGTAFNLSDTSRFPNSAVVTNKVSGDTVAVQVTYTASSSTPLSKNVGNYDITPSYILINNTNSNYVLPSQVNNSLYSDETFKITKATIGISNLAISKVYDASKSVPSSAVTYTSSGIVTVNGIKDDVTIVHSASFSRATVGSYSGMSVSFGLTGNDAVNYNDIPSQQVTGYITKLALQYGDPVVADKVYDGTTTAASNLIEIGEPLNLKEDDVISIFVEGAFENKNVGTGKNVVVTYTMGVNVDSPNYLAPSPKTVTANITKKDLTITGTVVNNKTYDGTTGATVSSNNYGTIGNDSGKVTGDTVSIASVSAAFETPSAGTNKPVTLTYTLGGADAGNYNPIGSATASINQKSLSVSGTTVSNKTYDGTTNTTVNPGTLSGLVSGDVQDVDVVLTGSGSFPSASVGTHTVTVSYQLSGPKAANYQLASNSENISGVKIFATSHVIKIGLRINSVDTIFTDNPTVWVYSGGNGLTYSAFVDGERVKGTNAYTVSWSTDAESVTNENATFSQSTTKYLAWSLGTRTIRCRVVENATSSVYYSDPLRFTLVPKPLGFEQGHGTTVDGKAYDGTTAATIHLGTVSGVQNDANGNPDAVTVTPSGSFDSPDAGTRNVYVTYALTGSKRNYYSAPDPETIQAAIGKVSLSISGVTVSDMTYDGGTSIPVSLVNVSGATVTGKVGNDDVSVVVTSAAFATNDVGQNKAVSLVYDLTGTKALNYNAPVDNGQTVTGNIVKKQLSVRDNGITVSDKAYDGNATAEIGIGLGGVTGIAPCDMNDNLLLVYSYTGKFVASKDSIVEDANVGTNKPVRITYSLEGSRAFCYNPPVVNTNLTANITPKSITIPNPSVSLSGKVYDGEVLGNATITYGTITGFVTGQGATLVGTPTYSSDLGSGLGSDATTYYVSVAYSLVPNSGTDLSNYSYTIPSNGSASAVITARPITISDISSANN